ncbi:MAG: TatD family hydrolase [Acidobacteriota bacterium]
MIDSHAHIAEDGYDDDRGEVLARAAAAGVEAVVVIGYDAASSRRVLEVVRAHHAAPVALHATAGVAPHNVVETEESDLAAVRALLDEPEVVAVGEIGLDYHYDMPPARQRDFFARQLAWAVERDLPVVIHSREAEDDVLAGLRDAGCSRGVIHCFTEGPKMAEGALELGFHISFAGIVTFKNAQDLRDIAARVPLERTLVETDSPYLAPVPHRGRRNEPAWVVEVARTIAELHGVRLDEVERVTSANARALFGMTGDRLESPAGGRGS